jgi:hypothetical protein
MNMMKIALLGTAALAAVSVSARADNLSDLKAQIEALNARVAAVETAPAVPAGFALMTVGTADALVIPGLDVDKNYGTTAHQIGIMPTADVDAPASTVVQWSGFVRAALVYSGNEAPDTTSVTSSGTFYNGFDRADVKARGEIKVVGKTDTAVGEVGAQMKLRADWGATGGINRGNVNVVSPNAWGYWRMTNELTLGGGMDGSLSGIGFGYDGACNCYYTDNAKAGFGKPDGVYGGDPAQMRLSYASGPMSAAIAIEDGINTSVNTFGVAAEIKYSGDTVSGEISGGYWGDPSVVGLEEAWIVGAGVGFALGDMAKISAAAGLGSDHGLTDDFWKANILASVNLSEAAHAEVAFNHFESDVVGADQNAYLAGVYYDPVSQLTIGLEGEYLANEGALNDTTTLDLVTVFRF